MNCNLTFLVLTLTILEISVNSEMVHDKAENFSQVNEKNGTEIPYWDNILCRGCGSDVTSNNLIISILSPSSVYNFNDTLFNKESVLVQVVSNDIIFHFPIVTFAQSSCVGIGEWEVDSSWFPGYHWKPCVCPDCGAFLGWVFETINPSYRFAGKISDKLIENMTTPDSLSDEDKNFLAACEEQLKDRYTENDDEFMKVFNAESRTPPIVESWWVPNNSGRRNDRRFNNRRHNPYSRPGRGGSDGYRDHSRGQDNRSYSHHSTRPRY